MQTALNSKKHATTEVGWAFKKVSVGHKSGKLPPLNWAAAVADTSVQLQRHLDVILEKEDGIQICCDTIWALRHLQKWAERRDDSSGRRRGDWNWGRFVRINGFLPLRLRHKSQNNPDSPRRGHIMNRFCRSKFTSTVTNMTQVGTVIY